jgi:hypothetical protein
MDEAEGVGIDELCQIASRTLRTRGHEMGDWSGDDVSRTAVCRRCGLAASVRTKGTLKGVAGPAIATRCRPPGPDREAG